LLALQVMARVRDAFHADLPLKILFEHPTVAKLARAIESRGSDDAHAIRKLPRRGASEVSPAIPSQR
jgi:hypothetical protein